VRVFIQTSPWAIWSLRFVRPVLPTFVIGTLMHRLQLIDSNVFVAALTGAGILSIFALLFGLIAFSRIWQSGDAGWRPASWGVVIGLGVVALFAGLSFLASMYPVHNDVTTNALRPPALLGTDGVTLDRVGVVAINKDVFGDVDTRQYPLTNEQFSPLLEKLVKEFGWKSAGSAFQNQSEVTRFYEAHSLIGFVDDVSIRVRTTAKSVVVDLRSASRFGESDFGANGNRIARFIERLDTVVGEARSKLDQTATDS